MHYICQGFSNCCKGCANCCHECCKSCCHCCDECNHCCDGMCKGCCECCNSCCESITNCLQRTFSAPFSFCTFVTAFVTGIPFILAIIAISKDWSTNCDKPINVHTLIEGICNLLNFLFCIYLCFRYGKKYSVPHEQPEKEEKNILQVTQDLILYDFVVCFYIFFVIFFLVWTIIGSVWLSEIDSNSSCYQNHTFLIRICLYNVIVMWIFLGVGLIVFLFTILVYACEDGSCTFYDMCRCSMLICSCGFCDIGKRVKKTNRAPPKNPPQNNSNWISKSKNFLGKIGILSQYSNRHNQPNYHQPNPESNMVMVQLPNAQYNNPPPPKYINPPQQYNNPPQQYNNPHYNQPQQYNIPQQSYNAPEQQYNVPQQQYNNPYPQLNNNPNQGYNYPKNNEVVNVNAENVSNEKEEKKDKITQIKDGMKNLKDKLKKYF